MALFIAVEVDSSIANDAEMAKKLTEVCPVNIFAVGSAGVQIVEKNLDECTLCELCLNAAPIGKVTIKKLYGAKDTVTRKQ